MQNATYPATSSLSRPSLQRYKEVGKLQRKKKEK
jgi:hypothetical protein